MIKKIETTVQADPSHAHAARKPMLWISVNKVGVAVGAEEIKKGRPTVLVDTLSAQFAPPFYQKNFYRNPEQGFAGSKGVRRIRQSVGKSVWASSFRLADPGSREAPLCHHPGFWSLFLYWADNAQYPTLNAQFSIECVH